MPRAKAHWKLVIFHKGKRIEKSVADKQALVAAYRKLQGQGVKVHIVSKHRGYWPKTDDEGPSNPDMTWCPYCRKWRYFSIPEVKEGPFEPHSEEWLDSLHRRVLNSSLIPWCQWCHISFMDFDVRRMNDMVGWAPRKSRRARRRRPVSRRR